MLVGVFSKGEKAGQSAGRATRPSLNSCIIIETAKALASTSAIGVAPIADEGRSSEARVLHWRLSAVLGQVRSSFAARANSRPCR